MSIKQSGGVFGRNPTFNDVTIEGQLTFDGDIDINSDLKINGNLDVIGGMTVDADTLVVNTGGDNVGIGTTSPNASGSLHILRSGSSIISNSIANSGAILENGSGSVGLNIITPNNQGAYINFGDPEDSNAGRIIYNHSTNAMLFGTNNGTIRLEIDASGNTNVKTGNLVIGTSGKGIDFSATAGSGTSELLDDYEEGTWTPSITDLTNTVTATSQGTYTKVGRHVICGFRVSASSLGSASGAIYISGLPFTVKNDNGARCTGAIGFTQNLNLGSAGQTVTIFPSNNQVYAALNVWDATVGTSGMQASELSATGALWGSIEYFV